MAEIQKADPGGRRTALAVVIVAALIGIALLTTVGASRGSIDAWIRDDLPARTPAIFIALMLLTAGPALGFSFYLWRLGRRVVRSGRYPPPGIRIVRDTLVETGPAANRRGRVMQLLAAVIGLAGLLAAFFLWRLMRLLANVTA